MNITTLRTLTGFCCESKLGLIFDKYLAVVLLSHRADEFHEEMQKDNIL